MPTKKRIILKIFSISLLLLGSCNQKTKTILYIKPTDEKLNTICRWLKNEVNFEKPNYKTVFYNYYNKNIKAEKYAEAAKAMEIVSLQNASFFYFDTKFFNAVTSFEKNYKDKVSLKESAFIYTYLGDFYSDKGNFNKSIANYKKVLEIPVNDYESCFKKGDTYRTLAWCYYCLGNQRLALENDYKALEYFKRTNRSDLPGSVYINISSIYQANRDFDNAIATIDSALYYLKKEPKKQITNIYIGLYNKINIYDHDEKFDKMYPLIDSVYHAFNKSGIHDTSVKLSIYSYYTKKLLNENKFEEAQKIITELEPEVKKLNSTVSNLEFMIMKATYEIAKNQGVKDTHLIESTIPVLMENKYFIKVRDCYSLLLNDAEMKKDFEKALFYEKERSKIKDSIGNQEMTDKTLVLEKKYQTEKKEQQILLHKKTILNKNTTIALLVSLFIGLFLIIIVYIIRQKQKKLKIEKENTQLYTKQLLEKTEEERKRIASDLHDSVSHELLSLKNSFEEKTEITNQKIDTIINDIRSISRNLHPIMFDKIGLKESINQMVERAQSVNNFMVTAEINYYTVLSSSDELQIYRIVQESLSNIIKYSDAIAAKISITENENNIIIEIKDNGKGFNVEETLNSKSSFGLHNIIERSRAIGGQANIISNTNGTIITIEIKKVQ
ncbi:tetratricopeptide repeat-containing sensor histidine kinase [Flavobacterium ajazii]|uniref:tetratricopeptide repeat-containing sensor histidine kinase n=1 Tax=Flavobacterium ajazii TaxID=2692318 RepID=UPI0013D0EA28|nr:sensor histidine kinase [Flavobacterium ajazii]